MPEMSKYCGQEFRVYKSAHKTCDTIDYVGARWMGDAVHLEGLRCDGRSHGGCQANCLLFWKGPWLEPVEPRVRWWKARAPAQGGDSECSEESLAASTIVARADSGEDTDGLRYRCQATDMNQATMVLPWWDLRQYAVDVRTRNVRVSEIAGALVFRVFLKLRRLHGYRFWMWLYRSIQEKRGGIPFPYRAGTCATTPSETLGLQPGELVQVKSHDEILQTVNQRNRNRGLAFDEEMVGYCGGAHRVQRRVDRIIDEKSGRMLTFGNECIVLDGATCRARFKGERLFCPRSVDLYWREIWLRRVDEATGARLVSPYQRESGMP
jgi:hypothetical protein